MFLQRRGVWRGTSSAAAEAKLTLLRKQLWLFTYVGWRVADGSLLGSLSSLQIKNKSWEMGASSGARPNNSSPGGNRTKVYGTKFPRTGRWVIWNRDNQGEALDMKAGKAGDRVSIPTLCCLFSWLLFWKPISPSSRSKTLSLWNYGLMTKGCSKANGLWRILRLFSGSPEPHLLDWSIVPLNPIHLHQTPLPSL